MGINFSKNKQNTKHDILIDVPQNTQQIFTKIVYNCGSVYEGYTKNKLYDGFGIYHNKNTEEDFETYTGEWHNNLPHGKGKCVYQNGHIYEGMWSNGLYSGLGKYIFKTGDSFSGYFLSGNFHGNGKLVRQNKGMIFGNWTYGQLNKINKIQLNNGDQYIGECLLDTNNLSKHGKGKYIYQNGDFYEGEWKNNKKHGEGMYKYHDGKELNGIWENDKLIKKYDTVCKICFEKRKLIILAPCGHKHFCKQCIEKLNNKNCPICKKTIESTVDSIYE